MRYLCWVSRNGESLSRLAVAAITSQQEQRQPEQRRQLSSTTFTIHDHHSNLPGTDERRSHVLRLLSVPDGELSLENLAWCVQYCSADFVVIYVPLGVVPRTVDSSTVSFLLSTARVVGARNPRIASHPTGPDFSSSACGHVVIMLSSCCYPLVIFSSFPEPVAHNDLV